MSLPACKSLCIRDSEIRRTRVGSALGSLLPGLEPSVSSRVRALLCLQLGEIRGFPRSCAWFVCGLMSTCRLDRTVSEKDVFFATSCVDVEGPRKGIRRM